MLGFALALAAAAGPDYGNGATWLCRPGRTDACSVPASVTVIAANGDRTTEIIAADPRPKVDCFYVYPTISRDPGGNSDLTPGPEEKSVAFVQAGPFRSVCRAFAPMYRQVTLAALRQAMLGHQRDADAEVAYSDVKAAWQSYLAHDNGGRGIVLIGHSQGSRMLKRLLQDIENGPEAGRMVSALLIGYNVEVPKGANVGGDFKRMPLCRSDTQTGCVISYESFRAEFPPPEKGRFTHASAPDREVACTNPAALGSDRQVALDVLMVPNGPGLGSEPMGPWSRTGGPVTTQFVRVPGLISARCVHDANGGYLAVTVNADPSDPRTDTVTGDITGGGHVLREWGLHLLDMNIGMGDMVHVVRRQADAWAAKPAR